MQATVMTATVEQTQRDLARLIRLAGRGEEVVITEAGQPVAKLTAISQRNSVPDQKRWIHSLRELRETSHTGKAGKSSEEILAEDRAGRD